MAKKIKGMNTSVCTSMEQSRKLTEIGIDQDTADMYWACRYDSVRKKHFAWPVVRRKLQDGGYLPILSQDLPCWSLNVLLKLLPDIIRVGEDYYTFSLTKDVIEYIGPNGDVLYSTGGESFVDAAVEMFVLIWKI